MSGFGELSERIARLEEQIKSMDERLERIERLIYGNSNPDSLIQRITRLEGDIKSVKTMNRALLLLLAVNLLMLTVNVIFRFIH